MDEKVATMINDLAPTIAAIILSIFGVLIIYAVFGIAVAKI